MTSAVKESLFETKHLIVEAGTGVGKSFAYLLPSALWAIENNKKVIVATYTKALQEQLIKKDLPVLGRIMEKAGFLLKYSVLMGSANYICLRRLLRYSKKDKGLFSDGEGMRDP